MITKKINIVILLIIGSLLLFGCDQQGSSANGNGKGLIVEFEDYAPGKQVYSNDKIPVIVNVKNDGEYSIPEDKLTLYLSGFDNNLIENIKKTMDNEKVIEKKEELYTFENSYDFGSGKIKWNVFNDRIPKIDMKFKVNACYQYETNAWAQVCVNPEILNNNPKNSVCRPGSAKVFNTQAPVKITGVSEKFISYQSGKLKVRYDVTISNIGSGTVWDKNKYKYDCGIMAVNSREKKNALNRVNIAINVPDGEGFECTDGLNYDNIVLMGNTRTISCTGLIKASSAYTTQVGFDLSYGYSIHDSTTVEILNSDI